MKNIRCVYFTDVSTSVPQSPTNTYQAKTMTPANTITTAPPAARSNVTVSEAKLSQVRTLQFRNPVPLTRAGDGKLLAGSLISHHHSSSSGREMRERN